MEDLRGVRLLLEVLDMRDGAVMHLSTIRSSGFVDSRHDNRNVRKALE
jgi:hypothetical protein